MKSLILSGDGVVDMNSTDDMNGDDSKTNGVLDRYSNVKQSLRNERERNDCANDCVNENVKIQNLEEEEEEEVEDDILTNGNSVTVEEESRLLDSDSEPGEVPNGRVQETRQEKENREHEPNDEVDHLVISNMRNVTEDGKPKVKLEPGQTEAAAKGKNVDPECPSVTPGNIKLEPGEFMRGAVKTEPLDAKNVSKCEDGAEDRKQTDKIKVEQREQVGGIEPGEFRAATLDDSKVGDGIMTEEVEDSEGLLVKDVYSGQELGELLNGEETHTEQSDGDEGESCGGEKKQALLVKKGGESEMEVENAGVGSEETLLEDKDISSESKASSVEEEEEKKKKKPAMKTRTEELSMEEAALVDTEDEDADDPSPVGSPVGSPVAGPVSPPEKDIQDSGEIENTRKRISSSVDDADEINAAKRLRLDASANEAAGEKEVEDKDGAEESCLSGGEGDATAEEYCLSGGEGDAAADETTDAVGEVEEVQPGVDEKEAASHVTEAIDRVASYPVSFVKRLRGTLTNLTKSDLEELVVQKLCEVITERSNVGELRRRAQALEQEQERWKEQSRALSKQMREMEMVMKNYQSEVQKQQKERTTHIVTPLRVTRSVGLQVNLPGKNVKSPGQGQAGDRRPAKPGMQQAMPGSNQAQRKYSTMTARTGLPVIAPMPTKRRTLAPALQTPPPPLTSAQPRPGNHQLVNRSPGKTPQPPPLKQAGSGVIDLTEEDDRQPSASALMRQTNTVRMVNSYPQSGNRVTYLLPTNATVPGAPSGSRQVLIATATSQPGPRHVIPPLVYKGASFVSALPGQQVMPGMPRPVLSKYLKHPAPLPPPPPNQLTRPSWKFVPPRPSLKISKVQTGIVLSWNMQLSPEYETIASYQLYAYQEGNVPPATTLWKKVGDVKALPLPMACTLTQFMTGHKYHFAVRAVDIHSRIGQFSLPGTIVLVK